jgi:hypothetical protein
MMMIKKKKNAELLFIICGCIRKMPIKKKKIQFKFEKQIEASRNVVGV